MKKALTILASFALFTSSTLTVVACSSPDKELLPVKDFDKNNDLNNLLGAAASQAKSMIFDNEFGISQTSSNLILNSILAKDIIKDFNPTAIDGLNNFSEVGDVVNTYLVRENDNYQRLNSKNVKLNNQKGLGPFLDQLIPEQLRGQLSLVKSFLLGYLNSKKDSLTGPGIVGFFNQIYDNQVPDIFSLLFLVIDQLGGKELIESVKPFVPVLSAYFNGIFKKTDAVKQIRTIANNLFDPNSENYLIKTLYENSTDQIPAVGKVAVKDVKKEILNSIERILNVVYVIPEETDADFSDISKDPKHRFSWTVASLITNAINGTSWEQQDLNENLETIVQEVMRIVTLLNAYFSFFDQIKTYQPVNDQHLFDATLNNYEYISQTAGSKTLGESDYVKDQAINFNYLLANLDYYFGSMETEDSTSAYRVQQGLFLLMNDPFDNYQENSNLTYENKPSAIADGLLEALLLTGAKATTGAGRNTILAIFNDPKKLDLISLTLFKPFILGIFNGEDLSTMITALNGLINLLAKQIPNLDFFQDYIDDIKNILTNANRIYRKDMLHHLLVDDLRDLFLGNKVINDDLLNRWFRKEQKVNLQTLITQPFTKILGLIDPSLGLNPNPGIGDIFINKSLPSLIGLANKMFNKLQPDFDPKTGAYQNADQLKALKSLNLNLPNFLTLINQLIGNDQGENNLFSNLISALFSSATEPNEIVDKTGLNVKAVFEALGMSGKNTFKKDSFLGSMLSLFLPLAKSESNSDLVLNEQSYQIDLLGLWARNLIDLLNELDKPVDYKDFLTQLINNDQTFNIKLKENELRYFVKNPTQIEHLAFYVEFSEPLTLAKITYLFRLDRQKVGQQFSFYEVTTNK